MLLGPRKYLISHPASCGQDSGCRGTALQRFFKLEIWLESGAQGGEEEGGEVVAEVLALDLLPGLVLRGKPGLKLCPPAIKTLDMFSILLQEFEAVM